MQLMVKSPTPSLLVLTFTNKGYIFPRQEVIENPFNRVGAEA